MQHAAYALALLLGLATLALDPQTGEAATYYVATTGSDANPGTETQPFRWPQACVDAMSAGDTCIVRPGTYSGSAARVTISNKGGSPGNPITLRAATPAVNCPDPSNNPDGCTVDTSARSIIAPGSGLTLRITGTNADWWNIEGFQLTGNSTSAVQLDGTSIGAGPNNINLRYMHIQAAGETNGAQVATEFASDIVIEHSYLLDLNTGADGPDYGIWTLRGSRNIVIRNIYFAGSANHFISVKREGANITIERIVCDGANSECIHIGQEQDDNTNVSGGTSCTGVQRSNGTVGTVWDQTSQNITVRSMFARPANQGGTHYGLRVGLRVDNVRNLDAQDLFILNEDGTAYPFWHFAGNHAAAKGRCGVEPGNNMIRGMVIVNPSGPCGRIASTGHDPATLSILNSICHGATSNGFQFSNSDLPTESGAWETLSHPQTIIQNTIFNDCTSAFTGQTSSRLTYSFNDVFNCGSPPTQEGNNLTVDPQFNGPENTSSLDGVINLSNGQTPWDWKGRYQPIIERFRTTNASLVHAGTGTAAPCTGSACDIGANEFFFELPPAVWESCAVYGNGDQVFGSFTNPWIDGRMGLVVDVDCARKRIVIGRCDDPEDEETCDTDIYIHKAAQLRKQRTNEPITLHPGTMGSDADTSGACWRTRATFDFTDNLEQLTGIWLRYEIDPDGGTHDCACTGNQCPQWAWQGAE